MTRDLYLDLCGIVDQLVAAGRTADAEALRRLLARELRITRPAWPPKVPE